MSCNDIQSLAANFLSLIRQHSHLKRVSSNRLKHKEAGLARKECHQNFWKFARGLLDGGVTSQIFPSFSPSTAHSFFSKVYQSVPHQTPSWMPWFHHVHISPSKPYSFPHHITPTNLRPDIMWWNDKQRELWLFELTVSYETLVADARLRKRVKYHDLVELGRAAGYKTDLITFEVGSRGMLGDSVVEGFKKATSATRKDISNLCLHIIRSAILGSFAIWTSTNSIT